MYTEEQEEIALKEYERLRYLSKSTLYHWYERRNARLENRYGHAAEIPEKSDHKYNTPDHPRHLSAEFKYEVLRRCFELGEDVEYVSREIGYSRMSIYTWQRKYLKYGMVGFMAKRKSIPRKPLPSDAPRLQSEEMQALQKQVHHLQFEVDVLKETLTVLKNGLFPGLYPDQQTRKYAPVAAYRGITRLCSCFHRE